jgi:hypothetical protein
MYETVQNRAILRIDDQLSDEDAKEWKEIVDSGDRTKNEEFLKKKGIDLNQIFALEALIYKIQMVDLMSRPKE